MSVLHVAPVLAADVRTQASALASRRWLAHLVTSWAWPPTVPAPGAVVRADARRTPAGAERALVRVPSADLAERLARALGRGAVASADRRCARVDRVASRLLDASTRVALCREDAALDTFSASRERGVATLYDLPIAHFATVQRLLRQEMEAFPGAERDPRRSAEFAAERRQRKARELELADAVLCPSGFVKRSLLEAGVAAERIHVLPFGSEPGWNPRGWRRRDPIVLSVGQISLRKGSHRLLRVWRRLGAHRTHRLRLIGTMRLSPRFLRDYRGLYEHVPALPRGALAAEYAGARLFVLNSLAEGLAVVIPEAMSTATPVLATHNSGAGELVEDGREGRLVPFGDDDALAQALDASLGAPAALEEMGRAALTRARSWTWQHYARSFLVLIGALQGARR